MLSGDGIKIFIKYFFIGAVGAIALKYLWFGMFWGAYLMPFGLIILIPILFLFLFLLSRSRRLFSSGFKDFDWKVGGLVIGYNVTLALVLPSYPLYVKGNTVLFYVAI